MKSYKEQLEEVQKAISDNRDFHVFIICLSQFILLYSLVFRVKFYKF